MFCINWCVLNEIFKWLRAPIVPNSGYVARMDILCSKLTISLPLAFFNTTLICFSLLSPLRQLFWRPNQLKGEFSEALMKNLVIAQRLLLQWRHVGSFFQTLSHIQGPQVRVPSDGMLPGRRTLVHPAWQGPLRRHNHEVLHRLRRFGSG